MFAKFGGSMPSAERNVLFLRLVRAASVAGCVTVPCIAGYAGGFGLSVWELESWFIAAMLLTTVPSGYLADAVGPRRVLQIGGLLLTAGGATYLSSQSAWMCRCAEVLLGMGHGFVAGTDEAMLTALLGRRGRSHEFAPLWARAVSWECVAAGLGFLIGGAIGTVHPKLPFVFGTCGYAMLLFASSMLDDERAVIPTRRFSPGTVYAAIARGYRCRQIACAIAFYAVLCSFTRVAFWSYSGYATEYGSSLPLGVLLAIQSAVGFASARAAGKLAERYPAQLIATVLMLTLALSFALLGLGFGGWMLLCALPHAVVRGVNRVVFTNIVNHAAEREMPELQATITSAKEMSFFVAYFGLLRIADWGAGAYGIAPLLGAFGGVLAVAALLMLLQTMLHRGRKGL